MGKINVLDKNVSELIAAGEVIERPASIVKELLENAIDAGASAITVEIKGGGISFIRITDNGSGFEKEDVPVAFLRHATSKVHSELDLEHIATLGFRGEALASISAVAKVELLTKTREEEFGTRMVVHGGETVELSDAGCPDGTTILVRNLFYNVPARLKFLKKDTSEGNAIQGIVEKIALSHPEISFKLVKDNKQVLLTAGDGKLLSAIYAVLGKEFAASLMEVHYDYRGVQVEGYVSKPSFCRSNRTMQHFFVNDRYVKSRTCLVSLEEAYKNSIMVSKFPGCVLKLRMDYTQVDVNVHPAKVEVRFVNEKAVFEAVYFAVKSALMQADILKTDVNEPKTFISKQILPEPEQKAVQMNLRETPVKSSTSSQSKERFLHISAQDYQKQFAGDKKAPLNSSALEYRTTPQPVVVESPQSPLVSSVQRPEEDAFQFLDSTSFAKKEEPAEARPTPVPAVVPEETVEPMRIKMIGELFKTYILFEANDVFVMIDKHAAHERILFEQLKASVRLHESQILLSPLVLSLSAEERDAVEENRELLVEYGFRFGINDAGAVTVLEAPLVLHRYDLAAVVQDMLQNIRARKMEITPEAFEDLLHSMACRAAIKANADNTLEELEVLVEQVYLDSKIRHCPHGRPVGITMTRHEIERKFGRLQ